MAEIRAIADPGLRDVLDALKLDIMQSINCVLIGKVEEVNLLKNVVSIAPLFKRELASGAVVEYPLLTDCPFFILSGGSSAVLIPPAVGDTCLVLFNDRDFDRWFLSGEKLTPNTRRTHSLSDGFALIGVRSLTDVVTITAGVTEIAAGTNKFKASGVGAEINATTGKVSLKNALGNMKATLDAILDQLALTTTTVEGSLVPINNAAAFTAMKTTHVATFLE